MTRNYGNGKGPSTIGLLILLAVGALLLAYAASSGTVIPFK